MNEIERRLADLPITRACNIGQMLQIFHVEVTEKVASAAITNGRPTLLINPRFVEQHCVTNEHLLMLVMHEFYHLLLGHTRLFSTWTPAHNIAADAMINAMLSRRFKHQEYWSFFTSCYPADQFPVYFLRPPEGYPSGMSFPPKMPSVHQRLIRRLYFDDDVSLGEIFSRVIRAYGALNDQGSGLNDILPLGVLLGGHKSLDLTGDRLMEHALKQVSQDWNLSPTYKQGRQPIHETYQLAPVVPQKPNVVLRAAILAAGQVSARRRGMARKKGLMDVQQVWPTRDRRAFAFAASGRPSLLYKAVVHQQRNTRVRVDIFVDVSGSMDEYISYVVEAILSCRSLIDARIWQFSIGAYPSSIEELQQGSIFSDGGTCIDKVSELIHEHKMQSVVILTDGWTGTPPPQFMSACKKANIHTVLTPEHCKEDLAAVTKKFYCFPLIT